MRAVLVLLLVLAPAASAAVVGPGMALSIAPRFRFEDVTVFAGAIDFAAPTIEHPTLVGARQVTLPQGDVTALTACPHQRDGSAPRAPAPGEVCRGGIPLPDAASISFGQRTNVRMNGTYDVARFPNASLTVFTPKGAWTDWAAVLPETGLMLSTGEDLVRIIPQGRSARTVVHLPEESRFFNGTEYEFVFQGAGDFPIRAEGIAARAGASLDVRLRETTTEGIVGVLDTRVLLDLAEAVEPYAPREPVRNLTVVTGNFTRVPSLLQGAVFGHLNGTLDVAHPATDVVLSRVRALDGRLDNGTLAGIADVVFTVDADGFAPPGGAPRPAPWILAGFAWGAAAAALFFVPAPQRVPGRGARIAGVAGIVVAAVVWDYAVQSALGVSAGSMLRGDDARDGLSALFVFEVSAFLLLWIILGLPARLAADRVLGHFAPAWRWLARLATNLGLALVAWLIPYSVLALGYAVARI